MTENEMKNPCQACGGFGHINVVGGAMDCPQCDGTGEDGAKWTQAHTVLVEILRALGDPVDTVGTPRGFIYATEDMRALPSRVRSLVEANGHLIEALGRSRPLDEEKGRSC